MGPLGDKYYKIKHATGRILGPIDLDRIEKLIYKNQISGEELAREYPEGEWVPANSLLEINALLLRRAQGLPALNEDSKLKSNQTSYAPILGETVLLNPLPPKEPTQSVVVNEEKLALETPSEEEIEKTELDQRNVADDCEATKTQLDNRSESTDTRFTSGKLAQSFEIESEDKKFSIQAELDEIELESKKISEEKTVFIAKQEGFFQKLKEMNLQQLIRIVIIAGGLGYFGYDTFLLEEKKPVKKIQTKVAVFKPKLPSVDLSNVDAPKGEERYKAALSFYVQDNIQSYKNAAQLFLEAASYDPENAKALALLASCYIHLVDVSNKDENYFGILLRLIELAKAKAPDIAETIIAEVEYFLLTNQYDAAVSRIVEYTKSRPEFDSSMFYYVAHTFFERGDYKNAAKYMAQYPDNKAFSPKVFFLKALVSEKLGDTGLAFSYYQKAITFNAKHVKSRLYKTILASKTGKLSEAKEDLEIIIKNPELLSARDLATAYFYFSKYFQIKENWETSFALLERAIEINPVSPEFKFEYYTLKARKGESVKLAKQEAQMYYYLGEGEKLAKQGKINEAIEQFLRAKSANADSALPYKKMGELFIAQQDWVNAKNNYQKAGEKEPNNIDIWSKYIFTLIQNYEWETAQKAMDRFRKLPVSQSLLDKAAGDFYSKQNRHPEAMAFYKKAMQQESVDPDVYIAFGKSLIVHKKYSEAPLFFALARRYNPISTEPVLETARAISLSESIDAAIRYLQDELQKTGVPRAEYLCGIAELQIQKGDMVQAQIFIEQAKKANPEYALPWKLQAQIYLNSESTDKKAQQKALDAFKSYSDRNSSDPAGYLERYRIFIKKAEYEKAEQELDRIQTLYPKYPNLHYFKGAMYAVMGNYKVSAQEYLAELQNNPLSIVTLIAVGKVFLELEDPKQAMLHLTKAMQISPQSSEAKLYAAVGNQRLKNFAGAIALFQAAIQIDPGNPLIYKKMGECYREMGDVQSAKTAFKKYLEMEPDAQDKREIERML